MLFSFNLFLWNGCGWTKFHSVKCSANSINNQLITHLVGTHDTCDGCAKIRIYLSLEVVHTYLGTLSLIKMSNQYSVILDSFMVIYILLSIFISCDRLRSFPLMPTLRQKISQLQLWNCFSNAYQRFIGSYADIYQQSSVVQQMHYAYTFKHPLIHLYLSMYLFCCSNNVFAKDEASFTGFFSQLYVCAERLVRRMNNKVCFITSCASTFHEFLSYILVLGINLLMILVKSFSLPVAFLIGPRVFCGLSCGLNGYSCAEESRTDDNSLNVNNMRVV